MFVGIAYDQIYPRQGGDFFGGALGVTAGYYDSCFGILAADSTDRGASVLISACGHGAGIQNDDRRLLWVRGSGKALLFELAF